MRHRASHYCLMSSLKVYLFLDALGLAAVRGLSLAASHGGYSNCSAQASQAVASLVDPGLQ